MSAIPQGQFADIGDGLQIHYHEEGTGQPVVFFHGSGPGASGYSNFKGNYPAIAARGFRVIVPDALGFGLSSKPEEASYSLDYLCSGALRLLDYLGIERCALVGNSLGGAMALQLAISHPDRVSALVLMAPGGLETRERYMEMEGIRGMMKTVYSKQGYTRESIRALFGLQLYDPASLAEETLDERLAVAQVQPRRVFETLAVPYLTPDLGKIQCPVFALWGTDDKFCPVSGAATLASGCADSRVLTLSRCGHWVMVEYPELFNRQAGDFLVEMWREER